MKRQIAPEALIALEFSGLPFHDSFHGLAVNGRRSNQGLPLPLALAPGVVRPPLSPTIAADGVGPAAGEDNYRQAGGQT